MSTGSFAFLFGRARHRGSPIRVLDEARTWLFPLYSAALTPVWLRLLGARVGRGVEASTVLLIVSGIMIASLALLSDLVVRSRDGV